MEERSIHLCLRCVCWQWCPEYVDKELETALMEECVRRASLMGATQLGLHTMEVMQSAMRMYERMGFVHTPALDFRPTEGILVKGYCRHLDKKS